MIFSLILGIVLGAVTVIFALQNVDVVTLKFFSWQFDGSLALIVLVAAAMGVITSLLIVLPESIGNFFRYRKLVKSNANLEEELKKQKELAHFAKKTPATPEELAKIDNGRIVDPHHPSH
jgi:uncharacterized integral membrane protein